MTQRDKVRFLIHSFFKLTSVSSQDDEWTINETYMDNISKYPKDWYTQMTRKKHSRSKSEPNKSSKDAQKQKKRNSTGSEEAPKAEETEEAAE